MKKVTLKTIADQLEISTVTVHKALNNQQGVSKSLREKIVSLANELGYERKISDGRLNFIHVIKKDFLISVNEQYYTSIYYYLNMACEKVGAKLYFVVHDNIAGTMATIKSVGNENPIDGIFISGQIDRDLLTEINKMKKPVVCIDFYSSDFCFDYVYADNYYAGYTLAKYLIKKGHKKICFTGDIKYSNSVADRYFGYLRALNKFDIKEPPMLISKNIERDGEISDELFPKQMPTAFICHCDKAASVLYQYIKEKGYNIPGDISVISFDNTDICNLLSPRLTSMGIEKNIFAEQAYQLMMQSIENPKKEKINYVKLNLRLYERASVKNI